MIRNMKIISLITALTMLFAETRANYIRLRSLREQSMQVVTVLYEIVMGQRSELDSLIHLDKSLKQFFLIAPGYTIAQLQTADLYLMQRLDNIDKMFKQLSDDVRYFHLMRDELENWRINVDEKIRVARNAIKVWAQSHRNLGAGIPVPPLIDVAGFASGLVGTAASNVVP